MNSPVPILLLVRELGIGGCERDVTKLALAIDRTKFTPHVGYFHEGFRTPELRAAGVPLVQFPVRSFKDASFWRGARQFGAYVRRHGIPLVHAWDIPLSIFTAPVARFYRVPVLVTSMLGHRDLFGRLDRCLLRLSDRLSPNILVNSEAVRRHMIDSEHVPARKIFVNHNGYDPAIFFPPPPGPRPRPAALAGAPLVIGTVCALRPEKNIALLLAAFARLRRPDVRLAIVGGGPLESGLRQQARTLGIEAACHFEPARSDVADWFRGFDVFVLPSLSESFPNALLEAMACGCASVATRVGGVPELLEDGRDGRLISSGDESTLVAVLEQMLTDDAGRRRLGEAAATRAARQFPMPVHARRIEAYYEGLLAAAASANRRYT